MSNKLSGKFYYWQRKGNKNFSDKNYRAALECYKIALTLTDKPSEDLLFKAAFSATKRAAKDSNLAIKLYRNLFELNQNYPYALNHLGYELYIKKDYSEAEKFLKLSLEIETDKKLPARNLFALFKKLGKFSEAREIAEKYPEHFKTQFYCEELKTLPNVDFIAAELNKNVYNKHSEKIFVEPGRPKERYTHQKEAMQKLTAWSSKKNSSAGLLVLPTGGGKTFTATYWLIENILDAGGKVIWIAHRTELLEQARDAFKSVCYSEISRHKKFYSYRMISGQHDRAVNIKPDDEILIASRSSLAKDLKRDNNLRTWIEKNADKIYLIIDEAHHAVSDEYRILIDELKNHGGKFHILGLTATPFRTAENEKGLLKKIFPDDILYKIDLHTLIEREILAEPIFHSIDTGIDMKKFFSQEKSEEFFRKVVADPKFDWNIDDKIASQIIENSGRNEFIADTYAKNKNLYGKTLVFAINRPIAVALNESFLKRGINSDYIITGTQNNREISVSDKERAEKIQKFLHGDLEVLINVTVLTEGTDLPNVQTVFLTRPTKSSGLMTQMIGRALRGKKTQGGTEKAYIVNFIDDWQDQIAWVNPEKLFIDENAEFKDSVNDRKYIVRLISIARLEEFARIASGSVDPRLTDEFSFNERNALGFYQFSYLPDGEDELKNCTVMVFDCMKNSFEELMDWLKNKNPAEISETEAEHIDKTLFGEREKLLGYDKSSVSDILKFYKQTETLPQWVSFDERADYDLASLAKHILEERFFLDEMDEYIRGEWARADGKWTAFFGIKNEKVFHIEIENEIRRIRHPEWYKSADKKPITEAEKIQMKNLSLAEIAEENLELYEKIRDYVFAKHQDKFGYYCSAMSNSRSKNPLDFEIDHIIPMARGGLTELDNLQLLTVAENRRKGTR